MYRAGGDADDRGGGRRAWGVLLHVRDLFVVVGAVGLALERVEGDAGVGPTGVTELGVRGDLLGCLGLILGRFGINFLVDVSLMLV